LGLYDWLLFLHVLSAFLLVGALVALWGLIIGTRLSAPLIAADDARLYGRIAGPIVGVGMIGAIVLGIALAIDSEDFHPWDAWIVAALVLWMVAGWAGGQAGRTFERDPVGGRRAGIRFQVINSIAILAILVLMIWKPGA